MSSTHLETPPLSFVASELQLENTCPEPTDLPQTQAFKGTDSDFPDWLGLHPPSVEWDELFPGYGEGDPWEKSLRLASDFDQNMCRGWEEEIQSILIFAGLFSAIVAAFAVEIQKLLQPDPAIATVIFLSHISNRLNISSDLTKSIVSPFTPFHIPPNAARVNILIFISLVLSLTTALVGILALQWIRSYRDERSKAINKPYKEQLYLRQRHYYSLNWCKIPDFIRWLPWMIQCALALFFIGLVDYFKASGNNALALGLTCSLIPMAAFLVIPTIAPALDLFILEAPQGRLVPGRRTMAFQSPQSSWFFFQVMFNIVYTFKLFGRIHPHTRMPTAWSDFTYEDETDDGWLYAWLLRNSNKADGISATYACLMSLSESKRLAIAQRLAIILYLVPDETSLKSYAIRSYDDIDAQIAYQPITGNPRIIWGYAQLGEYTMGHLCLELTFRLQIALLPDPHPWKRYFNEIRKKVLCKVILNTAPSTREKQVAFELMIEDKWPRTGPKDTSTISPDFDKLWLLSSLCILRDEPVENFKTTDQFFYWFLIKLLISDANVAEYCIRDLIATMRPPVIPFVIRDKRWTICMYMLIGCCSKLDHPLSTSSYPSLVALPTLLDTFVVDGPLQQIWRGGPENDKTFRQTVSKATNRASWNALLDTLDRETNNSYPSLYLNEIPSTRFLQVSALGGSHSITIEDST